MRYRVKNAFVVATKITEPVQIGKAIGKPGDYLVQGSNGVEIMPAAVFEANYVPFKPGRRSRQAEPEFAG